MPNVPGLWQTQSVQCSGTMHWRELKLLSWERDGRKSTTRGGTGLPTRHTTTETLHDWTHRGTDLTTFKQVQTYSQHTHTHTHPFNGPFSSTRKAKPIWILLKQETVSGSVISWAICKSAPRSRQITTPAPHHSVFLQAGCPSCHPTYSNKALKAKYTNL